MTVLHHCKSTKAPSTYNESGPGLSIPFNASVHLFLYVLVSSFLDLMCFHQVSHPLEDTEQLKMNTKISSSPMSISYRKFICRILCILSIC